MIVSRRNFLIGMIAAPAVIRTPGLLMPVKAVSIEPKLLPPGTYTVELARLSPYQREMVDALRCPRKLWFDFKLVGTDKVLGHSISIRTPTADWKPA